MSAQNFELALSFVLQEEGGYSNDPKDPGGSTEKGVTQATFNGWLRSHGMASRDVRTITSAELSALYAQGYWLPISGDNLPAGIDYATMDYAVNSGVAKAAITLQEILDVAADGKIGPLTIAAAEKADAAYVINRLCDSRLSFLERLATWAHFGSGWSSRVHFVRQNALKMVS